MKAENYLLSLGTKQSKQRNPEHPRWHEEHEKMTPEKTTERTGGQAARLTTDRGKEDHCTCAKQGA